MYYSFLACICLLAPVWMHLLNAARHGSSLHHYQLLVTRCIHTCVQASPNDAPNPLIESRHRHTQPCVQYGYPIPSAASYDKPPTHQKVAL